jgi:branched-chain amino acid transport system permease protein
VGLLIQIVVSGIAIGAVYGLIAQCLTVIYRLTGVAHLALGELGGTAVFATLLFATGPGAVANESIPLSVFLICATGAICLVAGLGAITYLVGIRPFLRRGNRWAWIGGVVAVAVALRGIGSALFPKEAYVLPDPLRLDRFGDEGVIGLGGGATLEIRTIVILVAAGVLVAVGGWALNRSRIGMTLRAVTQDAVAARLCGVDVDRWLLGTFALTAAIAGLAALIALPGTPITIDTGTVLGLKGLVAAVLARFGPLRRVFVWSLCLGIFETALQNISFGATQLGPALAQVLPLGLVLLVMAVVDLDEPTAETT